MGGKDRQTREPDEKKWQKEGGEDEVYATAMMVMAFLMMELTAIAGIWIVVSAAVVTTGFVAIKGTGRRKKAARMMMTMFLTTAAVWLTLGSRGGDRSNGAIGGLVIPGMHPIQLKFCQRRT